MPQFQVLDKVPGFGEQLGQQLGGGLGQGIASGLDKFYEQKQNVTAATGLANQLKIPEDQKQNFINTFRNIPAKDQLGQFEKLMLAQAYGQYAGAQGQSTPFGQPSPSPAEVSPSTPEIGGFPFTQEELKGLQRKPTVPPFGPFQKQAEIEDKTLRENRKEIAEYSKPYENTSELQSNLKKLQQAKKILSSEDFNVSTIRKAATAILEGKESSIAELFKTPSQQKLFYLLRDSLKPKDIGGSNPSTREVLIALSAMPSYLKGKEANEFIINKMIDIAEQNLDKGKLISGLRKLNDSASPADFKEIIESKISKKYADKPESTKKKQLTKDQARKVLEATGGNADLAREMATEQGFEF